MTVRQNSARLLVASPLAAAVVAAIISTSNGDAGGGAIPATIDPADLSANIVLSGSDLIATSIGGSSYISAIGSLAKSEGLHSFEATVNKHNANNGGVWGICRARPADSAPRSGTAPGSLALLPRDVGTNGDWLMYGTGSQDTGIGLGPIGAVNAFVLRIDVDLDIGRVWFTGPQTTYTTTFAARGMAHTPGVTTWLPQLTMFQAGQIASLNFGQSPMVHAAQHGGPNGWFV